MNDIPTAFLKKLIRSFQGRYHIKSTWRVKPKLTHSVLLLSASIAVLKLAMVRVLLHGLMGLKKSSATTHVCIKNVGRGRNLTWSET
jgi:hypothetical protein